MLVQPPEVQLPVAAAAARAIQQGASANLRERKVPVGETVNFPNVEQNNVLS